MVSVPLLLAFFGLPGLSDLPPVDVLVGDGCYAVDVAPGLDNVLQIGQRVTARFTLEDGIGHVLADSEQRGLPFSFAYGSPQLDVLLSAAVEGMHSGGERVTYFQDDFLPGGLGSIVPPATPLVLRLKLD